MNERSVLADKFRGTLVGLAVGDALGAPFEGNATVSPDHLAALMSDSRPLQYTDDTHMTLGMAEALIERGHFDGARLAAIWAGNYRAEPWRGYGPGPVQVFDLLQEGVHWDQAGQRLYGGRGSWGNGAAMRVAPAALLAFDDLERVVWLVRQTAMITHTHPLGVEGAVLQAVAIALLLQQPSTTSLDVARYLETLRAHVGAAEYCQQLDTMPELLPGGRWAKERADRGFGCGVAAYESVPTALYCFLRHRDDFAAAVTFAIRLGGDTDTIAAMTGALAGARLGESRIPARWQDRVEGVDDLRTRATSLLGLARSRIPMKPDNTG